MLSGEARQWGLSHLTVGHREDSPKVVVTGHGAKTI